MSEMLNAILERARAAQAVVAQWSQAQIDEAVAAVGWALYREDNAAACAHLAAEETGMGIYADKLLKHRKKTLGALRDLQGVKTVGVVEEDKGRGLLKFAKPVGVVGALTPVTNPSSTICCKALAILKGRNAVIFAPHPGAKRTAALTCDFIRAGLRKVGAPEDLAQTIAEPSVELVQQLMARVDLVVATGGAAMVKAAYSSGTPAYGVGAGNAVTIVDETADLADAAHKIALSKTFDHATSCSSENSAVIHTSAFDAMVGQLQKEGGHLCSPQEKAALRRHMWPDGTHLGKTIPGRPAQAIAAAAGLTVPDTTRFLMVMGDAIGSADPFSGEKLSPVLTLWRYGDFAEAISYVERLTAYSGRGHSCGIHTRLHDHVVELGLRAPVSRIMVRQPQCYANSGDYVNGMPFSLTLGCGTWGGNVASENITWKHFINTTWVSTPIAPVLPDEEAIFGEYWARHGK